MLNTLFLFLALAASPLQGPSAAPEDKATMMLNHMTADQPLVHVAVVDAPVSQVWKAYTTTEGILQWMVASGTVDLRVGGLMRTSYKPNSDLKGPDVIENQIMSFDPERMVSIRCIRTPENFPFKNAIKNVWTVVYFRPVEGEKTEVTCRMLGFDGSKEATDMRLFFMKGNQYELDELVKFFADKKMRS